MDLLARAGVGPQDHVVDVGGGRSRLAAALLDRGFQDVTVLTVSGVALEAALRRLGARGGRVDRVRSDVLEWASPRPVAAWHDGAVSYSLTDPVQRTTTPTGAPQPFTRAVLQRCRRLVRTAVVALRVRTRGLLSASSQRPTATVRGRLVRRGSDPAGLRTRSARARAGNPEESET